MGAKTKIKCRHNKCGHEYYVRPDNFLSGKRCPSCYGTPKKINEKFVKEVYKLVKDEYVFLDKYINRQTKIKCKHNKCGNEYYVSPGNFLNGKRCPYCMRPNYNRDTKQFKQEVYELEGDNYDVIGNYINANTPISIRHNICGYTWKVFPSLFLNGVRCPKCAGVLKKSTKQFKQEVYDLVGDEYIFFGEYINNHTKLLCKHKKCGYEWMISPSNFLTGKRCPQCFGNMLKTQQQFENEVYSLVGKEYSVVGKYINNKTKIKIKHNTCGFTWQIAPSNFLRGRRCPQCSESKGEQLIRKYLESQNINFEQEYSFDDLIGIGGGFLRFDFAVFDNTSSLKFLIEYDGEFHFEKYYEDQNFDKIQIHDQRKNQYCKDNNIQLLRIPYWKFNDIEKILNKGLNKHDLLLKA